MTRQRKEIQRKMFELEREESAECKIAGGFLTKEIQEAYHPLWVGFKKQWAETYGRTVAEHEEVVFERQNEAYEAGKIPWQPDKGILDVIYVGFV